jgi:hypothetical protein
LLNRALKEYAAFEKELKEIQQKGFSFSWFVLFLYWYNEIAGIGLDEEESRGIMDDNKEVSLLARFFFHSFIYSSSSLE